MHGALARRADDPDPRAGRRPPAAGRAQAHGGIGLRAADGAGAHEGTGPRRPERPRHDAHSRQRPDPHGRPRLRPRSAAQDHDRARRWANIKPMPNRVNVRPSAPSCTAPGTRSRASTTSASTSVPSPPASKSTMPITSPASNSPPPGAGSVLLNRGPSTRNHGFAKRGSRRMSRLAVL
jgi:hypothetical protein